MAEIIERMPLKLANKYAELERKKNLFASRPPRATFAEILELEHEMAGLRRLIEEGKISGNEGSGPKRK